jgi:hypothetical protein
MKYTIAYDKMCPGIKNDWFECKRKDRAKTLLLESVYTMLRANALLDTRFGHEIMESAQKLVIFKPKPGYEFYAVFRYLNQFVEIRGVR